MANREILRLVDSAPVTLVRNASSALGSEVTYAHLHAIEGVTWSTLDHETLWRRADMLEHVQHGAIHASGLSAKEMLRLALDAPKSHLDDFGGWIDVVPHFFRNIFIKERFGSLAYHNEERTYPWVDGVRHALWSGHLWEFGVVAKAPDGHMNVFHISFPWDDTQIPWYRRLTVQFKPFQSQQVILDAAQAMLDTISPPDTTIYGYSTI
jgi:hypothetical protein